MKTQPAIFIITGPPGSGKSSLIDVLQRKGVNCYPELAREVIYQHQIDGIDIFPWNKMLEFSDIVLRKMDDLMADVSHHSVLDRSAVDLIAYLKFAGISVPQYYYQKVETLPVRKKVFYAPFWEDIYVNDDQRKESLIQVVEIDKQLRKAYLDLGFELVEIPKIPVVERGEFVYNLLQLDI